MITIYIIIGIILYILNLLLNRWIYFKLIELDEDFYPNPPAVFFCFWSLLGTIPLLVILIAESNKGEQWNWFTPKNLKK